MTEMKLADSAVRFATNPLLRPQDLRPSRPDWVVECILNPGAFLYGGRVGLLIRVAERPPQEEGWVSTPVLDPQAADGIRVMRVRRDDPDLNYTDPRAFTYRGEVYLTTLSHLRLAWSDDGHQFKVEDKPTLIGQGRHESFGVEDCRVTQVDGHYVLMYTAVSPFGAAVGAATTKDWQVFDRRGILFPPHNKDCAIFPRKTDGMYWALHRPSGVGIGGNNIWIASSPDMRHWGNHQCLVATRPGGWDAARIGAGAAPIETPKGWLEIYHGADSKGRYCLGAFLMDLNDPTRVLARSKEPIMEPLAPCEQTGFYGNVVFTNGHIVRGDQITLYYGAADTLVCGATLSISQLLQSLAV